MVVEVTEMNLRLIHHPRVLPFESLPANEGFDISKIKALLQQLEKLGVSWEAVETSTLSDEELLELYSEAIIPAVHHRYRIRQVFGSKRNSGSNFGKGIPALVVYEPGQRHPSHVYPHRAEERIVTIMAFLQDLMKKMKRAPTTVEDREPKIALVKRMDRLRKEIGPIGVRVAELVREGRRR